MKLEDYTKRLGDLEKIDVTVDFMEKINKLQAEDSQIKHII
jgi:hypothetical protein